MIVRTNLAGPGEVPACPPAMMLVAAIDVEWSKNYRVRGGNVPFCYSVIWLAVPGDGSLAEVDAARFWYRSAYVENTGQTADLVEAAGATLASLLRHGGLIAGHQLCSDLAVLAAAIGSPPLAVTAVATAWRQRRQAAGGAVRVLDTRYDAGHAVACSSRRLVDMCTDLGLDVTQPELRGTSMTALHRRWLEHGEHAAREKISVLNLRHALSITLIAARAAGLARWRPRLNVNRLLAAGLGGAFGWLDSPAFATLAGEPDAA